MADRAKKKQILRITKNKTQKIKDSVVKESPLTIHLNNRELITLLSSPAEQKLLGIGFLVSEGIIKNKKDIISIRKNQKGDKLNIKTKNEEYLIDDFFEKRTIPSGCGKSSLFHSVVDYTMLSKISRDMVLSPDLIFKIIKEFQSSSQLFEQTGGVHSCGLYNFEKQIMIKEDIGRHNAADKLIGDCFLNKIPMEDKIIVTSGRISSEILLKFAKQSTPVLISRSAPTDIAVDIARKINLTLVGFVRGSRMNIYSGEERIIRK